MSERIRHWTTIAEDLPKGLSPRALRCIGLAIGEGIIENPDQLRELGDYEIRLKIRGRGQAHGIGVKSLGNIRALYPRESKAL